MESKLREPLEKFADICEARMARHDDTRGARAWKTDTPQSLFVRFFEETDEALKEFMGEKNDDPVIRFLIHNLRQKMRHFHCTPPQYDKAELTKELADIANFCMMIADSIGGLD